jgi:hypothetical protein
MPTLTFDIGELAGAGAYLLSAAARSPLCGRTPSLAQPLTAAIVAAQTVIVITHFMRPSSEAGLLSGNRAEGQAHRRFGRLP